MAVVANLGEKNKDNWRGGLTLSINYPRPRLTPPASVGYWARELLAPVKGVVDTAVIHRRPLIRPAGRSAKGAWLFGIVLHSLLNPDRSLVAKVALSRNPSAMWASLFLYFFFFSLVPHYYKFRCLYTEHSLCIPLCDCFRWGTFLHTGTCYWVIMGIQYW